MDRLFLDANVLFSAAYRSDAPMRVLWRLLDVELFTSTYAAEEARRNLREDRQRADLAGLLAYLSIVEAYVDTTHPALEAVRLPEKDVPIVLGALGVGATHLVTGDLTHFGTHYGERIGGVLILPPARYLRERTNPESLS